MKSIALTGLVASATFFGGCAANKSSISNNNKITKMEISNREKVVALVKSIETGAHEPVAYINPTKYIQHNLGVAD